MAVPFRLNPTQFPVRDSEITPLPDLSARQATFIEPEFLFTALDGRLVRMNGLPWELSVYSVQDHGSVRWLQIGLEGTQSHMLLLKLASGDGPLQTLRALTAWFANPEATESVQHAF